MLTNQSLPFALSGPCDLVGRSHLRVGHPANHKDDEPRAAAVLGGRLVLVPVAEPCTA